MKTPLRFVAVCLVVLGLLLSGASGGGAQSPAGWSLSSQESGPGPQMPGGAAAVPTVWVVETVARDKVGLYSSIQVDDAGWPHIAYYDVGNGDLKYAFKNASGWHIETVDSAGNVGGYPSLALDELGQANISYCLLNVNSPTQCEDLKYAIKLSGVWHNQVIDDAGVPADKVGEYSSLEVEGGPDYEDMSQHISYYDRTNQQLKYCWGTGAFWACGVVDTEGDVGRYSSLEVASSRPHIAYQHLISGTSAELKYALHNGSAWVIGKVEGPGSNTGGFSSLDLCTRTKPEIPHIGYRRDGRLGYAYLELGPMSPHWELSTADSLPSSGISLALDDDCRPHMSYYETKTGGLHYYRATAGDPQFEIVPAGGSLDPSATTSLALDKLGRPHISFYADSAYGDLRYAHKLPGVFLPLIVR